MHIKIWHENLKEGEDFEDVVTDGIILKPVLNKQDIRVWTR
jgi:hypothetical protein